MGVGGLGEREAVLEGGLIVSFLFFFLGGLT